MPFDKNRFLTRYSQKLRRDMTKEEKSLWYNFLIRYPDVVKRQYVFGNYIVDFVILIKRIVIEVDGRQHLTPEMKASDAKRDAYLNSLGFRVLRFPNSVINDNIGWVAKKILDETGYTFDDLKPVRKKVRREPERTE